MPDAAAHAPTPAAEALTGWLRRRGCPWLRACSTGSCERCWKLLLAHPCGGRRCQYAVLRDGQAPKPPRKNKPRRG